jgi:acyl-CoA reductase-like NAD-dependent aldehyde dehydrogenase
MEEAGMTQATLSPQIITGAARVSSREEMDAAAAALQAKKGEWTAVTVAERIAILGELSRRFLAVADRWAALGIEAEGLDPASPASGEEALVGPYFILRNLRLLRESLLDIQTHGRPRIPGGVRTRGNQVVARVFPLDLYDRAFYAGVTADVWMEPAVTEAELPQTQAVAYHAPVRQGHVALVLGAGNVSSIGPMDALYKLFVEDQVVLFKTHPVNVYLGPLLDEAFQPLAARGFFRLVYGGAEEGAYLCRHPGVDEIHITGSDQTYDAIVFGPGEEGKRRKAANEPLNTKRFTAELGNVSPVIVVPGPWDDGDLAYQAENLATMITNNAGFNCNAGRMIVQHAGWTQRGELMTRVGKLLAEIPVRTAYYPGASKRYEAFLAAHPDKAEIFGVRAEGKLPWMLIPGVDPEKRDDICFTTEAFCGVCGETGLAAANVPEFLDRAVAFCNDTLWGTLNVTLIVHPASLKDPEVKRAVDRAVANLRYGTISVNHWAAVGFGLVVTPWGAFPGHTPQDIRSGTGFVHNTLMFERIQKTVIHAPFYVWPKPIWFATHKTAHRLAPKLYDFEASPALGKLPGILGLALRG